VVCRNKISEIDDYFNEMELSMKRGLGADEDN